MKVTWFLEKDVFGEGDNALKDAVKDNGFDYNSVKYIPFDDKCWREIINDDKEICAIFHGSLNLATCLRKNVRWIPGVYGDAAKENPSALALG